ncbi:MAG TPA: RNA polymerase sigma factor region1.1 domain-containing protein, partial [Labilithrix sp.]|nr:RNA polymerase sigma factor region1.1 domain-containing protein [Labilithrix sp.]
MAKNNRNGNGKDTDKLVDSGKAKGFMTYDEVNESLPADVSVDQMDDVMG